jgi:SNF2 family DNA or RNA helicase
VIVINYEAAWREPFASWALERNWDLVVLDEAHRIKGDKGKASKFCAKLRGAAKRVTSMSGTPMPHGPLDVFAQYRAIEPGIFGTSMTRFKIRYGSDVQFAMGSDASPPTENLKAILANSEEFAEIWSGEREFDKPFNRDLAITFRLMNASWTDQEIVNALIAHRRKFGKAPLSRGHYIAVLATAKKKKGYPVSKYSNLEELRERMDKIRLYVDRDVLDLPDAVSVVKHVTLSAKEERVHKELERDLVSEIEAGRITAKNALTKLLKLQQAICGWAKPDEGEAVRLGTSRQEALTEILEDCGCPGGEAAVVFCRFHKDLDAVHEAAVAMGCRSCELSGRLNNLEEWQAEGGPEVLAVQTQAGGLGVDLTRARYSVFYSLSYSLGDHEQALARVHRPGQERKVTHIHLLAPGTIDEHVFEALQSKKDVIEFVIKTLGGDKQ